MGRFGKERVACPLLLAASAPEASVDRSLYTPPALRCPHMRPLQNPCSVESASCMPTIVHSASAARCTSALTLPERHAQQSGFGGWISATGVRLLACVHVAIGQGASGTVRKIGTCGPILEDFCNV